MGFGEEYMRQWEAHYFALSIDERNDYKASFPEPESWPHWYSIVEQIQRTRIEDDAYFADLKSKDNASS
ncbi:hypothetical protein CFter6_2878 [Collimonas fungivorans]|uniref:Phage protein n=1 Tax=Collimonas fungivorans TaxID=158899 RepID=A0A127PD44_9BURK|nr:hypothetical protein [Collimonas fungivorans]AMO95544.1 hypothetical protein CFter6_2878 [Collimonas fungivorans]